MDFLLATFYFIFVTWKSFISTTVILSLIYYSIPTPCIYRTRPQNAFHTFVPYYLASSLTCYIPISLQAFSGTPMSLNKMAQEANGSTLSSDRYGAEMSTLCRQQVKCNTVNGKRVRMGVSLLVKECALRLRSVTGSGARLSLHSPASTL
jgi:hypothetical protein